MNKLKENNSALLQVKEVKKYFPIKKGLFSRIAAYVYAVDGVSFKVEKGETLGLVGESGCGKTTLGRVILQLYRATEGEIYYKTSPNLNTLSYRQMRPYRKEIQVIFQDPYSSLNPRMTVGATLAEPLKVFKLAKNKPERTEKIVELLQLVGLSSEHINRYPHEFSGGQRQRVSIARALAVNPALIVADEPVSALDVSIQAQIINLLIKLQKDMGLSYIFISHDLAVVEHTAQRVAVMYLGKLVEIAKSKELFRNPKHPYTIALLSAIPVPDPKKKSKRIILPGEPPSPVNPPRGCRFHPRCPKVMDICREKEPLLENKEERLIACHLY